MLDAVTSSLRTLQALPVNAQAIAEMDRVSQPYRGEAQAVQPIDDEARLGPLEIGRALRSAESMVAAALGVSAFAICINANIRYYQV